MLGSLFCLAALAAGLPSPTPTDPPKDGAEVVAMMR